MLFVCLFLAVLPNASAQVITTAAGRQFTFPESVAALESPTGSPSGIAVDPDGNLLIASREYHLILRLNRETGMVTVFAGNGFQGFSGEGGEARNASLNRPGGVAVDSEGNVYIADQGNHRVRRVSPNGSTITTIAGTGVAGYSGDGGPGNQAALNDPRAVAVDTAGNVYIADARNQRVRRVSPNGIITTYAGDGRPGFTGDGGPAAQASMFEPSGVSAAPSGILYISDFGNDRVRAVSPQGVMSTFAGSGTRGFSGDGGQARNAALGHPTTLYWDTLGNLFLIDSDTNRVRRVSSQGVITTVAGNGTSNRSPDGAPAITGLAPAGLAKDSNGNLLILEGAHNRVFRLNSNNTLTAIMGREGDTYSPDSVQPTAAVLDFLSNNALGPNGSIYIAGGNRIKRLDRDGRFQTVVGTGIPGYSGDGGLATRAQLTAPFGVAVDDNGNIFIADTYNHRIRRVSSQGIITTIAGTGTAGFTGDGGPASQAQINLPLGIAVDRQGNVYFSDLTLRVRRISPSGIITTFAGNGQHGASGDGGPATQAGIGEPYGITFDADGNLYVSDRANHLIRRVTPIGLISTVAGSGVAGFSGDGGNARSARLRGPRGVVVDSQGNLFFSDADNHAVRRVTPGGIITTVAGTGVQGVLGDGGPATAAQLSSPYGLTIDAQGNLYISESFRLRAILAAAPAISVTPSVSSLTVNSGELKADASMVKLAASVPGLAYTAEVAPEAASWLKIDTPQGVAPANLTLTVDARQLPEGPISGAIRIRSALATPNVLEARVNVNVAPGAGPKLGVSSERISFAFTESDEPANATLRISNEGSGVLPFQVAVNLQNDGQWLEASLLEGQTQSGDPVNIELTANPADLAPGSYTGTVSVTANEETKSIPVVMTVTSSRTTILLSQSALTFRAVSNGGSPLPQSFGILNIGSGSMDWTASLRILSGTGNWIRLSSTRGSVARPSIDVSNVEVRVSPGSLTPGEYYAQIEIRSDADNSPQMVSVLMNVLPAESNPGPEIHPTSLVFTGVQGANPASQEINIANLSRNPTNFESARLGNWFLHAPEAAEISPTQPRRIVVQPDYTNAEPGLRRGTLTLQFQDGTVRTISILSVVAPAASADRTAAGCPDNALRMSISSLNQGFVATAGQAVTLSARVVDACGQIHQPEPGVIATVEAAFNNGDPQVKLTHIGNGNWTGTWRPVAESSNALVTLFAFYSNGRVVHTGGQQIAGSVRIAGRTPLVTEGGITHAATFKEATIAPGTLIAVFGRNLADSESSVTELPWPVDLQGTEILLGDRPLPLLFASENQLNVQVPYDVPPNTRHQLIVRRNGAVSVPEPLSVIPAQPGIFTVNEQGFGQAIVRKMDGTTIADAQSPAAHGERVIVYCTGLGAVTPEVAPGQPAPTDPPARVVNPVAVRIGGVLAEVHQAILASGSSGLYHVEITIPQDAPTGDDVPIVVETGGQVSPQVTVAIR